MTTTEFAHAVRDYIEEHGDLRTGALNALEEVAEYLRGRVESGVPLAKTGDRTAMRDLAIRIDALIRRAS